MDIVGSLVLAIVQSILFYGKEIGISMLIFEIIGNGIIFYILKKKDKIKNKSGFLLIIPIILLSSSYFIFANRVFYIWNVFILIALNILMYVIVTGKKGSFTRYIYNIFSLINRTLYGYKEAIDVTKETSTKIIKEKSKVDSKNIKKVAVSIVVVFVIVAVVISLLASADRIFASIFSGIEDIFNNMNVLSFIIRIAVIIALYFLFFSFILNVTRELNQEEKKKEKGTNKYSFTIKLLLISLNIVYIVFCYIQIQSLFAKINLSENFNYATYARTGFFQLMFVSFINFAVILISNRYNESKEKSIKMLSLLLIIFTTIIAISSMYRMHMYEMEYGLTYLRSFVYIILVTEIAVFIPTACYIINSKVDFVKWYFIIGVCVYCGINFIDLEKTIINKNVNRDITSTPIDYAYISSIASEDSYSILEERLEKEGLSSDEKLKITRILLDIASEIEDTSWQEFNISKWKIKEKQIDTKKLQEEVLNLQNKVKEEEQVNRKVSKSAKNYVYREKTDENEEYLVEEVDRAMGDAFWEIGKLTDNGTKYTKMNMITVKTPSKIKFYEGGLGFLESPKSIYCGEADLLVTHDSGKTFDKINFPEGEFTLSDPLGEKWENCYDYFYLPTKEDDGTLVVLASGGYEGGYNQGKTRAKYISKDKGYTWEFVGETKKE